MTVSNKSMVTNALSSVPALLKGQLVHITRDTSPLLNKKNIMSRTGYFIDDNNQFVIVPLVWFTHLTL